MRHWSILVAGLAAAGAVVGLGATGAAQGKGDPAKGKQLYVSAKCVTCHGEAGQGDGPQAAKLKDKPSDWSKDGGGLKGLDDQKVFDSIAKGGPAIGRAKAMPASPKLSEADVWNLVAYVKALGKR
jgi:mono/diheme cytochrome c family protein